MKNVCLTLCAIYYGHINSILRALMWQPAWISPQTFTKLPYLNNRSSFSVKSLVESLLSRIDAAHNGVYLKFIKVK